MRKNYFTLIELLVVVAIIGILCSILLPSLSKARESAKQMLCLSNLKQTGTSMLMYCESNNDVFPPRHQNGTSEDWLDFASAFYEDSKSLDCPSTEDRKFSYGYNHKIATFNGAANGAKLSQLTIISEQSLFNEIAGSVDRSWAWGFSGDTRFEPGLNHFQDVNFSFVDGHAKIIKKALGNSKLHSSAGDLEGTIWSPTE